MINVLELLIIIYYIITLPPAIRSIKKKERKDTFFEVASFYTWVLTLALLVLIICMIILNYILESGILHWEVI